MNLKPYVFLSLALIVFDQISKYWAEHILRGDVIEIFAWFDFSLVHNTGAAFGFLNQAGGWQHVFFVTLAIVVSIALIVMTKQLKAHERHLALAYSLIVAGALGNAIDRVIYQYVVDFIHWYIPNCTITGTQSCHWPHFNIADSVIFVGAFLLITEAFEKPFLNKGTS